MNTMIQMWKGKIMVAVLMLVSMVTLSSCDWWHDDQADCDTHLRVKIIYEMNMEYDTDAKKFMDLFNDSVAYVNLFAFDKDGNFVYGRTQSADAIKAQGGYIEVDDMPAGEYNLLVWAEGKTNTANSYTYGYATSSQYISNYDVTVNNDVTSKQLTSLFHGYTLNADLNPQPGETKEAIVELTKDTNTWHIFMGYESGKEIDPSRFDFKITDSNGYLAYDNSLNESSLLTYTPYSIAQSDTVGTGASISSVGVHITVNRLLKDNDMHLYVTDKVTGKTVYSGDIMPYAIEQRNNRTYRIDASSMDKQEYLDREDDYYLTFYLKDDNTLCNYLDVLSWRIVLGDYDLGKK